MKFALKKRGAEGVSKVFHNEQDEYEEKERQQKRAKALFDDDLNESETAQVDNDKNDENVLHDNDDDDDDPLDSFMSALEKSKDDAKMQTVRVDLEAGDEHDDYIEKMRGKGFQIGGSKLNEEDIRRYREDGIDRSEKEVDAQFDVNELDEEEEARLAKKNIKALPPINHAEYEYDHFVKQLYLESESEVVLRDEEEMHQKEEDDDDEEDDDEEVNDKDESGKRFGDLTINGEGWIPNVIVAFSDIAKIVKRDKVRSILDNALQGLGITDPTLIQSLCIPIALSGRDLLVSSPTGSGKTLAYLIPVLIHILANQRAFGCRALVLAPTRELVQQIYLSTQGLVKSISNITAVPIYGGASKMEQFKRLRSSTESQNVIVISTPGRLIDMIKMKAFYMDQVTMIVLDEADRMLQLGFEEQVACICQRVRPDRQTLMFSATIPDTILGLAKSLLDASYVSIASSSGNVGQGGSHHVLNKHIRQSFNILESNDLKWSWLTGGYLQSRLTLGSVVIFVTRIDAVNMLSASLNTFGFSCTSIHGDMNQNERSLAVKQFSNGTFPVLVATDVAGRGLDIVHVKTVINYDLPRDIEAYVHRIGRTGRSKEKQDETSNECEAVTLICKEETWFSGQLVMLLEANQMPVPPALRRLAFKNYRFKRQYFGGGDSAGKRSGKKRLHSKLKI